MSGVAWWGCLPCGYQIMVMHALNLSKTLPKIHTQCLSRPNLCSILRAHNCPLPCQCLSHCYSPRRKSDPFRLASCLLTSLVAVLAWKSTGSIPKCEQNCLAERLEMCERKKWWTYQCFINHKWHKWLRMECFINEESLINLDLHCVADK